MKFFNCLLVGVLIVSANFALAGKANKTAVLAENVLSPGARLVVGESPDVDFAILDVGEEAQTKQVNKLPHRDTDAPMPPPVITTNTVKPTIQDVTPGSANTTVTPITPPVTTPETTPAEKPKAPSAMNKPDKPTIVARIMIPNPPPTALATPIKHKKVAIRKIHRSQHIVHVVPLTVKHHLPKAKVLAATSHIPQKHKPKAKPVVAKAKSPVAPKVAVKKSRALRMVAKAKPTMKKKDNRVAALTPKKKGKPKVVASNKKPIIKKVVKTANATKPKPHLANKKATSKIKLASSQTAIE